jgi:RNA polymerase sigma factor (sigma-70 family)
LLYKSYFPSIASYIKQNLGNNEDAEDIFQEAILVLLQKVRDPDFILTSSLKTYLYAICKNLWLKRIRDNKVKTTTTELSLINSQSETDHDDLETEKSNEVKVKTWLKKITKNCEYILKALFFYNEPMENLMAKMGWKNKHTASNQKHKCIKQIKIIVEEKEA